MPIDTVFDDLNPDQPVTTLPRDTVFDDLNSASAPVAGDLTLTARNGGAHVLIAPDLATLSITTGWLVTATAGTQVRSYEPVAASALDFSITGLVNDLLWTVTVVPLYAGGQGEAFTATVTPLASAEEPTSPFATVAPSAPAAPTVSATAASSGANLVVTVPDAGGAPLTSLRAVAVDPLGVEPDQITTAPGIAGVLSYTFSIAPLTNGTQYSITVVATNVMGDSLASAAVLVTPSADAPPIETPPVDPIPVAPPPQPMVEAFPVGYPHAPPYFLKTPAEALAIFGGGS